MSPATPNSSAETNDRESTTPAATDNSEIEDSESEEDELSEEEARMYRILKKVVKSENKVSATTITSSIEALRTDFSDYKIKIDSRVTKLETAQTASIAVVTGHTNQLEDIEKWKAEIEVKLANQAKQIDFLTNKLENNTYQTNINDYKSRRCNLELTGMFPIIGKEPLNYPLNIATSVVSFLLKSNEKVIEEAHRVQSRVKGHYPIIVRCASIAIRDRVLAAYRAANSTLKYKDLNTSATGSAKTYANVANAGIPSFDGDFGDRQIYVSDHLPVGIKEIFAAARFMSRKHNWRCWAYAGKIFVKLYTDSEPFEIKCVPQLGFVEFNFVAQKQTRH